MIGSSPVITGTALIFTMTDGRELQPEALATEKLKVPPASSPAIVVLVPVPVAVVPSGDLVIVQVPVSGKPLNITLPVSPVFAGWVINPTTGADGDAGLVLMVTADEDADSHPKSLVTINVYVPAASPDTVLLVPDPENVPPGVLFKSQVPDEGRPLKTTLPEATAQVGCVIAPTTGADGVGGCASITTLAEDDEVHPDALVTLKVYVASAISSGTIVLVPVPVNVLLPGDLVMVQVPDEGKPLNVTLPVAYKHSGCRIVPTSGAVGVEG